MTKVVVGLFDHLEDAQAAVHALLDDGYPSDDISLVAQDAGGGYRELLKRQALGEDTGMALAGGAGMGALVGGLGGLLVGLAALAIPGIGPVVAAGPLVATLAAAGIGAAAGGLLGALTEAGLSEPHARLYSEGVRRGGILVVVHTGDERAHQAVEILNHSSAVDIEHRSAQWQAYDRPIPDSLDHANISVIGQDVGLEREHSAASNGHRNAQVRAAQNPSPSNLNSGDYSAFEPAFRRHYHITYSRMGSGYDTYQPAYSYGCQLAASARNDGREWLEIEPEARRGWELHHPGLPWEQFRDAVRQAWDTVRRTG